MQISNDGLVRLSIDELLSTTIQHLFSSMDECGSNPEKECGRTAQLSGYTEWVAYTQYPITLGWDWRMEFENGNLLWFRTDLPRSNVLIVDSEGKDLAWTRSLEYIGSVVDALAWQKTVGPAIGVLAS